MSGGAKRDCGIEWEPLIEENMQGEANGLCRGNFRLFVSQSRSRELKRLTDILFLEVWIVAKKVAAIGIRS